ncbi:hypothetical protein GCM10010123_02110 [Pilimelia anulata]|uniref:Uncharacterized protein n=1 Tax=Pilimelia anulata TaxID=53371 RepID=A0A8J3B3E5_9ACTN|nr:hypothetical protein [Pilimelia anulata]GGJ75710.1 hypothetical protein GCM10010123_02110 [Pilimelia anulata]
MSDKDAGTQPADAGRQLDITVHPSGDGRHRGYFVQVPLARWLATIADSDDDLTDHAQGWIVENAGLGGLGWAGSEELNAWLTARFGEDQVSGAYGEGEPWALSTQTSASLLAEEAAGFVWAHTTAGELVIVYADRFGRLCSPEVWRVRVGVSESAVNDFTRAVGTCPSGHQLDYDGDRHRITADLDHLVAVGFNELLRVEVDAYGDLDPDSVWLACPVCGQPATFTTIT